MLKQQKSYLTILFIDLQTEVTRLKTNCKEPLGDLQFRKRRRDAIRTINSGGIPRASTLSKYKIEFDSTTKLYK